MTKADFVAAIDRLLNQTAHWETPRWRQNGRAATVRTLAQELADLAADAEGGPRRTVPEIGEMSLPDQIRVLSDDVLTAEPGDELLSKATEAVVKTRQSL